MTAIKLLKKVLISIIDHIEDIENTNYSNGNDFEDIVDDINKYSDIYTTKLIDQYGGEGKGEDYWLVFSITNIQTNETKLIQFQGVYDSWNGIEWYDDPYFVVPKEVTVIQYVEEK